MHLERGVICQIMHVEWEKHNISRSIEWHVQMMQVERGDPWNYARIEKKIILARLTRLGHLVSVGFFMLNQRKKSQSVEMCNHRRMKWWYKWSGDAIKLGRLHLELVQRVGWANLSIIWNMHKEWSESQHQLRLVQRMTLSRTWTKDYDERHRMEDEKDMPHRAEERCIVGRGGGLSPTQKMWHGGWDWRIVVVNLEMLDNGLALMGRVVMQEGENLDSSLRN